ncbi:hypothetical protein [Patulibacter minatonensis]|uniref:hypothetical protein n=1 Tax=Patulibacter minatonensis TaxID=298163 RepID=UPI00047B21B0|nr:hypothetical protein [Patulibacter minatonensis]
MDTADVGKIAAALMDALDQNFAEGDLEDLTFIATVREGESLNVINISTANERPADKLWMLEHTKQATLGT